jgi:hypothetical protein
MYESFMNGFKFFILQNLLKTTGAQGKTTVFLITDTQIKEESFLEDIDALLNSGEVPNLFATDEKAEIMEVHVLIAIVKMTLMMMKITGRIMIR